MEQLYLTMPKEVLIIVIAILIGLFIFLFQYTIKKLESAFDNINARLDIVCINQEATDYALNQCKLSNGKPFIEHRNDKKRELLKELEIKNKK